MSMLRASLLVLAGCHAVFGIDEVTPPEELPRVTGTYLYTNVLPTGVEIVPPPAGEIALALEQGDGTAVAVALADDGTFSFPFPDGEVFRLRITGWDAYPVEIASRSRALRLGPVAFGRRARTPVTRPTRIDVFTNATTTAGHISRLASTGLRTYTASEGVGDTYLDWLEARVVDDVVAPVGLLDEALGDRLYYLNVTNQSGTHTRIAEYLSRTVTLVDGQPTAIGSIADKQAVSVLAADRCVHLISPIVDEIARLESIVNVDDPAPANGWNISAVPARDLGSGGRILLTSDVGLASNDSFDVVYGSPFPSESEVALQVVNLSRPLVVPGTTAPLDLTAIATNVVVPVDPTVGVAACASNIVDFGALRAPTFEVATLGDSSLLTDNQQVFLDRTAPVPFSFTMRGSEPFDHMSILVHEISEVANTAQLRTVRAIHTTETTVMLDPGLFARNRRYVIGVAMRQQYPGARDGDFTTQSLPSVSTVRTTPSFQPSN